MKSRIELLAEYTKGFNKMADIACDHAKISITAIENNYIKSSIASDIAMGPLQNAINTVKESNLEDKITCLKADGLNAVTNDVEVIVIAGLGGTVITEILEQGKEKLSTVKRLVLQANIGQNNVRMFLMNNNFRIVDEIIFEDGGITYEIIVAEHGHQELNELEIEFGPIILKERSNLFLDKLKGMIASYDKIISQIPEGKQTSWLHFKRDMVKGILDNEK